MARRATIRRIYICTLCIRVARFVRGERERWQPGYLYQIVEFVSVVFKLTIKVTSVADELTSLGFYGRTS